jgi:hypothetical protein
LELCCVIYLHTPQNERDYQIQPNSSMDLQLPIQQVLLSEKLTK